jgi:hypothetical protein
MPRIKKRTQPTGETVCLAQKGKNQSHDSSREEGSKRGRGRKNFRARGVGIIPMKGLISTIPIAEGMGHMKQMFGESHGRRSC